SNADNQAFHDDIVQYNQNNGHATATKSGNHNLGQPGLPLRVRYYIIGLYLIAFGFVINKVRLFSSFL
ncbi:MAG: hypothetical protein ACK57X_12960, partial [Bacteroidota bacterium]